MFSADYLNCSDVVITRNVNAVATIMSGLLGMASLLGSIFGCISTCCYTPVSFVKDIKTKSLVYKNIIVFQIFYSGLSGSCPTCLKTHKLSEINWREQCFTANRRKRCVWNYGVNIVLELSLNLQCRNILLTRFKNLFTNKENNCSSDPLIHRYFPSVLFSLLFFFLRFGLSLVLLLLFVVVRQRYLWKI